MGTDGVGSDGFRVGLGLGFWVEGLSHAKLGSELGGLGTGNLCLSMSRYPLGVGNGGLGWGLGLRFWV